MKVGWFVSLNDVEMVWINAFLNHDLVKSKCVCPLLMKTAQNKDITETLMFSFFFFFKKKYTYSILLIDLSASDTQFQYQLKIWNWIFGVKNAVLKFKGQDSNIQKNVEFVTHFHRRMFMLLFMPKKKKTRLLF